MKPASQTAAEALEELQWHHSAGECEASTPNQKPSTVTGEAQRPVCDGDGLINEYRPAA